MSSPGTALDQGVVELLQSTLAIRGVEEVDVSVAERAAGDGVTADTNTNVPFVTLCLKAKESASKKY